MKKISVLVLVILCLCTLIIQPVFAIEDLGTVLYWYSDSSDIGFYSPKTVKVAAALTTGCQMPGNTLLSATNAAFYAWSSSEGLTLEAGTTSDYGWLCQGISRSEAQTMGIPNNAEGATAIQSKTLVGKCHTPSGTIKNVYSYAKSISLLIWDSEGTNGAVKTSDYTQAKWNAIDAHEFGHAAGYAGHDNNATSTNKALMYPYTNIWYDSWNVSTPQTRDTQHMSSF